VMRSLTRNAQPWMIDLAGLVALAGITALGVTLALRPALGDAAQRARLQADRQERASLLEDLKASLADHRRFEERYAQAIESSTLRVEPLSRLNARLGQLTRDAEQLQLRVDQMIADEPTPHPEFTAVPIHVAGSGSYAQIVKYFALLETEYADTHVKRFDIARAQSPEIGVEYSFDVVWVAQPEPEEQEG